MNDYRIYAVSLNYPLNRLFDYTIRDAVLLPGTRVNVSFGHQKNVTGVIITQKQQSSCDEDKLRSVHEVLDNEPTIDTELLALCQWCAEYYHYPLGEVLYLAMPALLRKPQPMPLDTYIQWKITEVGACTDPNDLKRAAKQQRALSIFQQESQLDQDTIKKRQINKACLKALVDKGMIKQYKTNAPIKKVVDKQSLLNQSPLDLNDQQAAAIKAVDIKKFSVSLLDGVTGSGKTEVYLHLIEAVLKRGHQALVLVPEIGLTPQTLKRFEVRFNVAVAALHSGLSDRQRLRIWQNCRSTNTKILIGTRSSIFTPLPKLGLIIVDEEHDTSYKQQEGVRYSARDVAIVRAQKCNIPLLLGTATPALETLNNALARRYQHLRLTRRAKQQQGPQLDCISSRDTRLNEQCINSIRSTLEAQQQVLVFINRRGYAPTLMCKQCGWISQCSRCDNRMTLHKTPAGHPQLACHYCEAQAHPPRACPDCNSAELHALGEGTQRYEEQLQQLFPSTAILRIDRDSVARKGEWETALNTINSGQSCIIIGTQMLAKGHHFAKLGLVLILGLDNGFFSADFRGPERMGQLLTQVSGRAGREQRRGKVLIQTQFAEHPLLQQLLKQDYFGFAQALLNERKLSAMPPYAHLALIRCHAQTPQLARRFLQNVRRMAEKIQAPHSGLSYLGPFASAMEKRNNRYHYLLQIKANNRKQRQALLTQLRQQLESSNPPRGLHWMIDIDPQEI
ncbi:MAG: primosomal protein N' [Pseudomonadota bacterium]